MEFLTKVYRGSTDPDTSYHELISTGVCTSILAHTFVYTLIGCIVFPNPDIKRMVRLLLPIIALFYIIRLQRAKALMEIYQDKEKVCKMIDNIYMVWYFLG